MIRPGHETRKLLTAIYAEVDRRISHTPQVKAGASIESVGADGSVMVNLPGNTTPVPATVAGNYTPTSGDRVMVVHDQANGWVHVLHNVVS